MKTLLSLTRAAYWLLTVCTTLAIVGLSLHAAPSLDVQKPPVVSGANPNTGPSPTDPVAKHGQWFIPTTSTTPQSRNYEFHDNLAGQGGGAAGSKAIYGAVSSIVYAAGPGSNIVGFTIKATLTNDTLTTEGAWKTGFNSHGEKSPVTTSYKGTLYRPVLVTEFAIASPNLFPVGPIAGSPYSLSPGARIIAVNHTLLAWYCFNNTAPKGSYYVPSWQFPDIAPGASASLPLTFRVLDGGITPGDSRYTAIVKSQASGLDILSNRSLSLKLNDWIGQLWLDSGASYFSIGHSSDVGVFHAVPSTP
jgi:hypothetical protein